MGGYARPVTSGQHGNPAAQSKGELDVHPPLQLRRERRIAVKLRESNFTPKTCCSYPCGLLCEGVWGLSWRPQGAPFEGGACRGGSRRKANRTRLRSGRQSRPRARRPHHLSLRASACPNGQLGQRAWQSLLHVMTERLLRGLRPLAMTGRVRHLATTCTGITSSFARNDAAGQDLMRSIESSRPRRPTCFLGLRPAVLWRAPAGAATPQR